MSAATARGVEPAAWDRASRHYDRQVWLERSAVRTALAMLDAAADERLLDVGTGTGVVLQELARRPRRPRQAVGVDTSPAMLARVRKLPRGWMLRLGDARDLPFGDAGFDIAVASYVLHVLPDHGLPVALAELLRVLRPGGRLVTVTPFVPRRGAARWLAQGGDALARVNIDRFGGLRPLDPRSALQDAGFVLRRARTSPRGYASICVLARSPIDMP